MEGGGLGLECRYFGSSLGIVNLSVRPRMWQSGPGESSISNVEMAVQPGSGLRSEPSIFRPGPSDCLRSETSMRRPGRGSIFVDGAAAHSGGFDPSQPPRGFRSEGPTTPGASIRDNHSGEPTTPGASIRANHPGDSIRGANHPGSFDPRASVRDNQSGGQATPRGLRTNRSGSFLLWGPGGFGPKVSMLRSP